MSHSKTLPENISLGDTDLVTLVTVESARGHEGVGWGKEKTSFYPFPAVYTFE
jgi:hypothetical protein